MPSMTDHNGFPIDEIPPRMGALAPLSAYKSEPVRITGFDIRTGKTPNCGGPAYRQRAGW